MNRMEDRTQKNICFVIATWIMGILGFLGFCFAESSDLFSKTEGMYFIPVYVSMLFIALLFDDSSNFTRWFKNSMKDLSAIVLIPAYMELNTSDTCVYGCTVIGCTLIILYECLFDT